jgi:hypothetical protein
MSRAVVIVACFTTLVASGCREHVGSESVTEPDPVAQQSACTGTPTPVSIERVERVLLDAGFSVRRLPEGAVCDQPLTSPREDILAELSNERAGEFEEVVEGEGLVTCWISRGPTYPNEQVHKNLDEPAYSPVFHGRKASWWFSNVECTLVASDSHPDEQIARADEAMERLAHR